MTPKQLAIIERAKRTPARIVEIERTRRGTAYRNMLKRYGAKAALERELERLAEEWSNDMKHLIALAVLGLLAVPAHAEERVRCGVYPDARHDRPRGPVIKCHVTADKVTIGKITVNRGHCAIQDDPIKMPPAYQGTADQGEHVFGDLLIVQPISCPSITEYSIEVDGEVMTFAPDIGD
jgi:hypothetical protein